MREIKFRAWDKDFNEWIPEESIIINKGKPIAIIHQKTLPIEEAFNTKGELINPDWELMQFTGLKDKNGVDIYEGDILLSKMFDERIGKWIKRKCKVMPLEEGVYSVEGLQNKYWNPLLINIIGGGWTVEVIGNIHGEELK